MKIINILSLPKLTIASLTALYCFNGLSIETLNYNRFIKTLSENPGSPEQLELLDRALLTPSNFESEANASITSLAARPENREQGEIIAAKLALSGAIGMEDVSAYLAKLSPELQSVTPDLSTLQPALSLQYYYERHLPTNKGKDKATPTKLSLLEKMNAPSKVSVELLESTHTKVYADCEGPGDHTISIVGIGSLNAEDQSNRPLVPIEGLNAKGHPNLPLVHHSIVIKNSEFRVLGFAVKEGKESREACRAKFLKLKTQLELAQSGQQQLILKGHGNDVLLEPQARIEPLKISKECLKEVESKWRDYQTQLQSNLNPIAETPKSSTALGAFYESYRFCKSQVEIADRQGQENYAKQNEEWRRKYNQLNQMHSDPMEWSKAYTKLEAPQAHKREDRSLRLYNPQILEAPTLKAESQSTPSDLAAKKQREEQLNALLNAENTWATLFRNEYSKLLSVGQSDSTPKNFQAGMNRIYDKVKKAQLDFFSKHPELISRHESLRSERRMIPAPIWNTPKPSSTSETKEISEFAAQRREAEAYAIQERNRAHTNQIHSPMGGKTEAENYKILQDKLNQIQIEAFERRMKELKEKR
ncbi:hypothetical protein GW915_10475 [bacterium]|nr:hypothetical protein [bacterium]